MRSEQLSFVMTVLFYNTMRSHYMLKAWNENTTHSIIKKNSDSCSDLLPSHNYSYQSKVLSIHNDKLIERLNNEFSIINEVIQVTYIDYIFLILSCLSVNKSNLVSGSVLWVIICSLYSGPNLFWICFILWLMTITWYGFQYDHLSYVLSPSSYSMRLW